MYHESDSGRKTMGDVDVVYHDGVYHLFHLVLPNHDFIAHAVSDDGLAWHRVENALFIGHPGAWDDSMLWTMHVSPNPFKPGSWRMFYTGLSQHDNGLVQRLGMATSDDLYQWVKAPVRWVNQCKRCRIKSAEASIINAPYDEASHFPLESPAPYYESKLSEGRRWISWRDPFYYRDVDENRGWLLAAARVPDGPVCRRGCVSLLEEVAENQFESHPSLFHPGLYDDIEVPNLLKLRGERYLIGSIREDAKIRYWHAPDLDTPWANFFDNVLLPKGNYAGRICLDEHGPMIWNFYSHDITRRTVKNLLPPPKRIRQLSDGQLQVASFEGFDKRIKADATAEVFHISKMLVDKDGSAEINREAGSIRLRNDAGFQSFLFGATVDCFRFRARLDMQGNGKCGLVFRIDPESQDGYFLSLDMYRGVAQLRAWSTDNAATGEHMMRFDTLQAGYWRSRLDRPCEIRLVAYGSYIEFSIDHRIVISLADQTFSEGKMGFYVESACVDIDQIHLEQMQRPVTADETLAQ
ncbi:glycosyl hydrolase [Blastopirellula marina]|uniref:Glycosyl hydrolase n=1 Tax=Blastopirellula marina TaxID=124 RepID=A0A2S8GTG8_9BACT|nr:glycosyl hydrolase [Blastopirellula marina]PQO47718.1 glycosyl hydrolase [Blastopirellula marina]